jgi:hypothetical protein
MQESRISPSLVQFDGRPLGGANFQHCAITQPCKNQNCNVVVDLLDLEKQN